MKTWIIKVPKYYLICLIFFLHALFHYSFKINYDFVSSSPAPKIGQFEAQILLLSLLNCFPNWENYLENVDNSVSIFNPLPALAIPQPDTTSGLKDLG